MKYSLVNTGPNPPSTPSSAYSWRPWPLRTPYLAAFCLLCALLIVTTEFITYRCADICRIFGKLTSATELSTATYFVYNLLPAILTVIFGLLWAVIHHDIMRMEPYFQMSAPGGAPAADSLFLAYSYDFFLSVPFEAFRRRHYVVFMSSCITVLVTMVITPLAAGIFDDTVQPRASTDRAKRAGVRSPEWLADNLGQSFSYMAYNYAWLNSSLPPFVTPEYALLPVWIDEEVAKDGEIWIAETVLFEVDQVCEDAIVEHDEGGIYTAWNTDRKLQRNFSLNSDVVNLHPSWRSYDGYATSNNTQAPETHLYAWASTPAPPSDPTVVARFCKISYHTQPVLATLEMPSGHISNITRSNLRTEFTSTTRFKWAMTGRSSYTTTPTRYYNNFGALVGLGYDPNNLANHDLQLVRLFGQAANLNINRACNHRGRISCPSTSIVGMENSMSLTGLSLSKETNETLQELMDPHKLESVFKSALQLEFALAVALEMIDPDTQEEVIVRRIAEVRGFRVNLLWARGTQIGLSMVLFLTVLLAVVNRYRLCELDGEPNSLAAALRLLWGSPELCANLEGAEFYQLKELEGRLEGDAPLGGDGRPSRYIMQLIEGQGPQIKILGGVKRLDPTQLPVDERKPWIDTVWQLGRLAGGGLLIFYGINLALLLVAFWYSQGRNGLTVYSGVNTFGYKVLYSYAPIALGMTVGPVLVTLGSFHCMLAPYKALKRGNASSPISIGVDFDKSPPHFQLIRSLRGRHIGLVLLTIAILLSNVLAVALAGLFSPVSLEVDTGIEAMAAVSPSIIAPFTGPVYEAYYTFSSNLSHKIVAPSWTTPTYYVLPFIPAEKGAFERCEGPTLGIGMDINCSFLPTESVTLLVCNHDGCSERGSEQNVFYLNITTDDPCWEHLNIDWRKYPGTSSVEYPMIDKAYDFFVRSVTCPGTIFAFWIEFPANPTPDLRDNGTFYLDYLDFVALKCTVVDKIAEIDAVVDNVGQVLSVVEKRRLDAAEVDELYLGTDLYKRLAPTFLDGVYEGIMVYDGRQEHQMMWLDYAMTLRDPSITQKKTNVTLIPNQTILVETFESIFRELFAINVHLHADKVLSRGELRQMPAIATVRRDAVKVNRAMFLLAALILIYIMGIVVILYWVEPPVVPGHLPYSLAGMYALLYASNSKEECGEVVGRGPKERAVRLAELGSLYSIGRFRDGNGEERVGVFSV